MFKKFLIFKNRYVLFFILIGLQATISKETVQTPLVQQPSAFNVQPQIKQEIIEGYRWPKETNTVATKLSYEIDRAAGNNLNEQQRANIVRFKAVCNEHLRKFMNQLDYVDKEIVDNNNIICSVVKTCLESFAVARELEEKYGEAAALKDFYKEAVRVKWHNTIFLQDLAYFAYLFRGHIGADVFKKAEKFCDEERECFHNYSTNENNDLIKRSFEQEFNHLINANQCSEYLQKSLNGLPYDDDGWNKCAAVGMRCIAEYARIEENAAPLRNQCSEYLQKFLNGLPYEYHDRWDKCAAAGMRCIAEYVRIEAEDNYTKENMDGDMQNYEVAKKTAGLKAAERVRLAFNKAIPGSLAGLFKKPINQALLEEAKTNLYTRLGVYKQNKNREE